MALDEIDDPKTYSPPAIGGDGIRPTRVRYKVLTWACALAIVTYVLRVGFSTVSPKLEGTLGLDESHVGWLMFVFMIAYGVFEVPWGLAADRFGVRNVLSILALGGSLTTAAVALVAFLPASSAWPFIVLLVLRTLFGVFQAGTFPAVSRMLADWIPTTERGGAQGAMWMASRIGGTLAPVVLTAFFGVFRDWSTPLVLASALGVVWVAGYWPWFRNQPEEMRQVNESERKVISGGRKSKPGGGHLNVPWKAILTSSNVWALCFMYGFLGYSGNFFLTMLPKYLDKYRGFGDVARGWTQSLAFAGGIAACILGGVLSDAIIRATGNRRWGRRGVGALGLGLAGLGFLASIWIHSPTALTVVFVLIFTFNDLSMGPAWAAATDIGERYAGTVGGMMNMMGSFLGAAGAAVTGSLLKNGHTIAPFVLFALSYGLAVACWMRVDATEPLILREAVETDLV